MEKLISKNQSIYVAGHLGMAGSAIIKALKNAGYGDNKNGGNILTQTRKELDLLDASSVLRWFQINKPEIIIIAAAKVGGIAANNNYPFEFISDNLRIQQNIFQSALKIGAKRLLFLGSSCIYPKDSLQPIKEEYLLSGYLEPTNEPYALAKIAGIKTCEALRKQYGFDAISLMPTNMYGPGDNYDPKNSHVFASLIRKIVFAKKTNKKEVICWGTGEPLREFLHVDDFGTACIHVLEKWDPNSKSAPKDKFGNKLSYLNVGSGREISIKSLAESISKEVDYKGKIIWDDSFPNGTFRKKLDSSRIESLGWNSTISLEEGISMVIKEIVEAYEDPKHKFLKNFSFDL